MSGPCELTEIRLYRSPYLVIPRLALQAMPQEWRDRMEALLKEADATGLDCPRYWVLRADSSYTREVRSDPEDETSDPSEYVVMGHDEWANYRRGDAADLCPTFKAPAVTP